MNKYFDSKFPRREKRCRRNYEIDDNLYTRLEELSKFYEASTAALINSSVEHLIATENITGFEKKKEDLYVTHVVLMKQSNLAGLDKLKDKYGVSLFKLVNMAIRNALNEG